MRIETLADYVGAPRPDAWPIPALDRRAALGCPRQRADGRGPRADRPRGPPDAPNAPRALHGAADRAPRRPWPERLLELAWRQVVENSAHDSDLWLLARLGGRPGPHPLRRGGTDRRGILTTDSRCDCRSTRPRCRGQPVADASDRPRRRSSSGAGRRRAGVLPRRDGALPTQELSRRDPMFAGLRCAATGSRSSSVASHGRELFGPAERLTSTRWPRSR